MSKYASSSCSADVTSPSLPPPPPSPPPAPPPPPAASMSAWRYPTARARPLVNGITAGGLAPVGLFLPEYAAAADLSASSRPDCGGGTKGGGGSHEITHATRMAPVDVSNNCGSVLPYQFRAPRRRITANFADQRLFATHRSRPFRRTAVAPPLSRCLIFYTPPQFHGVFEYFSAALFRGAPISRSRTSLGVMVFKNDTMSCGASLPSVRLPSAGAPAPPPCLLPPWNPPPRR